MIFTKTYTQNLSKILLLTVNYPYGSGEQFLAGEIEYLSKKDLYIEIYPYSKKGQKRRTPQNIEILEVPIFHRAFIYLIGGLFSIIKYHRYYISDLVALIKKEKSNIFYLSRITYIINYMLRSALFIAWFDFFYKKNITQKTLIYSYWMNSESYALSILKRANPSLKTITRVHGGDLYMERNFGFLPFRKEIIDSVDKIFTISDHGKEYLIFHHGSQMLSKIEVSRLGVTLQERLTLESEDEPLDIIIASCSSDDPVKRIPEILSTLGYFSNNTSKKVIWLNIGIDKDTFIKKYADDMNKYPNLYCELQGVTSNNHIKMIYKKFKPTLFINLSSSEGVPVSIMEAFSFGIPVLATNVGGTSEIVNKSVGSLVDVSIDYKKINKEINKIICCRETYSINAWKQWKDFCDSDYNYEKHYNYLNEVLNERQL